jgi:CheY-like chemotaxis protein
LLTTNDKKPVRILCVDDELLTVDLLKRVLEPHGYEVVTTTDSAEALRKLLTEPINLVTTDIKSPGTGGLEFIRRVKEFDQSIPVIIISGYETKETAREAVRLGVFDYRSQLCLFPSTIPIEQMRIAWTHPCDDELFNKRDHISTLLADFQPSNVAMSFQESRSRARLQFVVAPNPPLKVGVIFYAKNVLTNAV